MNNIDQKQVAGKAPAFFSEQIVEARRFVLDLRPGKGSALSVVCGGLEVCDREFQVQRRRFPYLAIEFVIGGSGTVWFGDVRHKLLPGSYFAYGPRNAHRIVTDPDDPLVKYFIDFSARASTLKAFDLPLGTVHSVSDLGGFGQLLDELLRWGQRDTSSSRRICASLLETILLAGKDLRVSSTRRETLALANYQRCRRVLEEKVLRLRSLDDLARECRVSREYLCRLFKRFDRMSPHQRLLRLKMNYATARLRQPGVLVKQVATELGFADPFHFSRTFRACFQMPPSRFAGAGDA